MTDGLASGEGKRLKRLSKFAEGRDEIRHGAAEAFRKAGRFGAIRAEFGHFMTEFVGLGAWQAAQTGTGRIARAEGECVQKARTGHPTGGQTGVERQGNIDTIPAESAAGCRSITCARGEVAKARGAIAAKRSIQGSAIEVSHAIRSALVHRTVADPQARAATVVADRHAVTILLAGGDVEMLLGVRSHVQQKEHVIGRTALATCAKRCERHRQNGNHRNRCVPHRDRQFHAFQLYGMQSGDRNDRSYGKHRFHDPCSRAV